MGLSAPFFKRVLIHTPVQFLGGPRSVTPRERDGPDAPARGSRLARDPLLLLLLPPRATHFSPAPAASSFTKGEGVRCERKPQAYFMPLSYTTSRVTKELTKSFLGPLEESWKLFRNQPRKQLESFS